MMPGDGLDNDCDGQIDEEVFDKKDNDGDGKIDEDLQQASEIFNFHATFSCQRERCIISV